VYGQPAAPEPKLWKALLVAALFVIPGSLMLRALVHMTDVVWFAIAIGGTFAVASLVHMRVRNDWRATYTMNLERFEKKQAYPATSASAGSTQLRTQRAELRWTQHCHPERSRRTATKQKLAEALRTFAFRAPSTALTSFATLRMTVRCR
jgi:hypothetical protein